MQEPWNVELETQRQKVALLYRHARVSLWVPVVNAVILAYVNGRAGVPAAIAAAWLAAAFAVAVARYRLASRFHAAGNADPEPASIARWRRRYLLGSTAAAAVWSGAAVLFAGASTEPARLFTGMVLAGMVAGSVPVFAPVPMVFRCYAVPVILTTAIVVAYHARSFVDWAFAAVAIIFLLGVRSTADYLHETLDVAIRLSLDRRKSEEAMRALAYRDPLTHLPNRRLLMDRLEQAIQASGRSGQPGALLAIDLDRLKAINDELGHDIGDRLLVEAARRLTAALRREDTVSRLGGDEYVVLLENLGATSTAAAAAAEGIAEKIRLALEAPYHLGGGEAETRSTASIGVTLFQGADTTAEQVMKEADTALYGAKRAGRNAIRRYSATVASAPTPGGIGPVLAGTG